MELGVPADSTCKQDTVHLEPGDLILFHTDGVTQAWTAREERLGKERLERMFRAQRQQGALQVVANLAFVVRAFAGSMAPLDSIAIAVAHGIHPGKEGR